MATLNTTNIKHASSSSNNIVLASDGTVSFASSPHLFTSYAIICDEKSHDTAGGTFTQGDWRDRDLNTEIADPDGIVSISSNQFTLGAGTYFINWSCPAYRVEEHRSRLYDVTGSAVLAVGFNAWSADSDRPQGWSEGFFRHTITSNNVYKLQHFCLDSYTNGFGRSGNIDDTVERYSWVKIFKEA